MIIITIVLIVTIDILLAGMKFELAPTSCNSYRTTLYKYHTDFLSYLWYESKIDDIHTQVV